MIFTETREGRRFVGEVPPDQPLVQSLRVLVENYRISSGWFEGTGYVRDALLRRLDVDGRLGEVEIVAGPSMCTSLRALISEKQGETDIVVRVQLFTPQGQHIAGELQEAVSGSVEILCNSFDDITLRRYHDPGSGLDRWLDVAVNVVNGDPEQVRSGRLAMEAMPSRLLEPTEMPALRVGDALQHPRLGICIISQVQDQDRVSIQMDSCKIAQLHLGLLTLVRAGTHQGRTLYDVHVRKRQ